MPTDEHYWQYGIVTACVCVPFFILVGSLNTTRGLHFWRHRVAMAFTVVGEFFAWLVRCGRPSGSASDVDGKNGHEGDERFGPPGSSKTTLSVQDPGYTRKRGMRNMSVGSSHSRETSEHRRPGAFSSLTAQPSHIANMIVGEVGRRRTITYSTEVSRDLP